MKKFNITVNGKTYAVEVEEVTGAQSAAQAPKAAPATAGAKTVTAPMPGTVVSIKVNVGDKVESGTLVAVLEAMKMENEIFAGTDGVVASINANAGDSVNTGDALVSIN